MSDYGEENEDMKFFLTLANKILDPDPHPHQLEKWDPDPHQNVLDPPHWSFFRLLRDAGFEPGTAVTSEFSTVWSATYQ